ncbi:E4 SUMO-protein ligase PIAL2-like [Salvia hispanica]|uniref:E4 SUMO-protein ligase PIAL2-like n=1 Tax=Salvia hispanica TaxID=49212 RepID=UPI0020090346|nr:E4 SUMO-protein ligase PIAL2-like [Salvia hispanica]
MAANGNIGAALTQWGLNNFRISAVIDRLNLQFSNNIANHTGFKNLFLSLSRGIDFCIANNYVPNTSSALPSLIKQVVQIQTDAQTQSAIMVLMVSFKRACQHGWFPDQDSAELINLAEEVASNFSSASDLRNEPNPSHSVISTAMSRMHLSNEPNPSQSVMSSDTTTIKTELNEEGPKTAATMHGLN